MRYIYFVSYWIALANNRGDGFGSAEINLGCEITDIKHIHEMQEFILDDWRNNNKHKVVLQRDTVKSINVISYALLRKEEDKEGAK